MTQRLMKCVFLILCAGFLNIAHAQGEQGEEEWISSVQYDSTTGNYIIKYGTYDHLVTVIYELPNKINPSINTSIESLGDGIYNYRYKVYNGKDSLQKLQAFEIGYWQSVISAEVPDKGWYSRSYALKSFWRWTDTEYQRVGIQPGAALDGFSFKTLGIPGIVNCYFQGYVNEVIFPEEYPEEIGEALKQIDFDLEKSYVARKTIGPTAPPAVFKPLDFLDNIINMKHEAFKLGWIKNQGILQSLDAKLDNAKKKLENGDTKAAKNILSAFINEVEAQGCATYENCPSGKHLTSEAYGLLKYNAQYLIDHLP